MGLFNKLKNALFEEDMEIPVEAVEEIESKKETEKKTSTSVEEKKEIKKPNVFLEEENERELFKAENTFKFPDFDEEEFQSNYNAPIENEEKEEYLTPKEKFDRVKPITYSYDKDTKPVHKETKREEKKEEPAKKVFKPSPVISPVYGILDKNYKKEDIVKVTKKEEPLEKPKKKFDIDAIRKKAFGTLEDDIESTFDSPKEDFYEKKEEMVLPKENKKENLEQTIEVPKIEKRSDRKKTTYDEEEIEDYPYPEVEENYPMEESRNEERKFEEDTLENDLFDLIDSMYDNREEEE